MSTASSTHCIQKVTIIGCGSVGATIAYAYLLSGTVTDLALIDIDPAKAEGLLLDLEHASDFTPNVVLTASSDYKDCEGSHLIVITAGKRQKEGETRLDLLKANKEIFAQMIPQIVKAAPTALLLVVTNPVDVLTLETIKLSGLPATQVFGSGTVLDSARLKFHISQKLKIHPQSIDAWILGEHGDTSFPVYSSANILGKPLLSFEGFNAQTAQQCYQDTKTAAYRIIHDQGFTCYSIAAAVREITEAVFQNKHAVFPLSTLLTDYYGESDVCLSVPVVLGRNGIERILEVPLNEEEQALLKKSAATLRNA